MRRVLRFLLNAAIFIAIWLGVVFGVLAIGGTIAMLAVFLIEVLFSLRVPFGA